ncbi:prolipoprotein diacylglyceryl transferase [Erythrobacter crassostreae]|uniref:Phosphatidylglycerol--prolipoprotein diacylglyceryl transferase n=1 Tax=Erythrobacter crassostreae TaxID=2828328 RepID=A0A9X1F1Y2_9SPHN|nr:prolipoprotein diacylglyceryl transferase [Erythrobacter crassostrea]
MLSLLAASGAAADPLYWSDLGLFPGFDLGFFTLRFYSLAYLIGIIFAYWHLSKTLKQPGAPMAQRHADDLFFYCTLGVILGGRLGYAIFYNPNLWSNPLDVLKLWEGGMSFHGGLIGVLLAIAWVTRSANLSFLRVCDYIAITYPLGHFLGRLANFNNGELWGRASDVSWAMVFPGGGDVARHPSQLYQAGLEGFVPFVVLMFLFWKTRARYRPGLLVGIFTILMGMARFVNEFFREPDSQLAEFAVRTGLSMGQWLTIPLILIGLIVTLYAVTRKPVGTGSVSAPA